MRFILVLLLFVGGFLIAGCDQVDVGPQSGYSLLAFSMPGCYACELDKPLLKNLESRGLKITYVNVIENPTLAAQYKVKLVPQYVLFKNGQVVIQANKLWMVENQCR